MSGVKIEKKKKNKREKEERKIREKINERYRDGNALQLNAVNKRCMSRPAVTIKTHRPRYTFIRIKLVSYLTM